jgi:hypothetical protein
VPNSWDENRIANFLSDEKTQAVAVDLTSGTRLLFVTQDQSVLPSIAAEANALFQWLGVPRGFTLILFWRDDPRIIKADEWPSRGNVNGGYAFSNSNEIVVYRQEEWDRVLIHEAIHALGWDWQIPIKPMPCWGLGEKAILAPHLFEAWTELYAEWLWCGWHSLTWENQMEWQEKQAIQILARAPTPWKENTNIFAYYVLKAALAPHIGFLWTLQGGPNNVEQHYILCSLVGPKLAELQGKAKITRPTQISMRMTHE